MSLPPRAKAAGAPREVHARGRPVLQLPPPDLPLPTGPTLLDCLVIVLLAVELLIGILPKGWRRRVNRLRFGSH